MTTELWTPARDTGISEFHELYNEDGVPITTHSMIKTFRRCPNQAKYKYVDRLKPKIASQPLERGKWMHSLLEAKYKGEDWKAVHKRLSAKFALLFDEEKEKLGDLPRECARLMASYEWHYAAEDLEVIAVEEVLEAKLPDGSTYRGKVDMIVKDRYGLWVWDHKTHKTLPSLTFRLLDAQSALYLWAALNDPRYAKYMQGFVWNYIKTKAPTKPVMAYVGTPRERLSKAKIETDYPTMLRAIKEYGLDINDHLAQLRHLKSQRYKPDVIQTSSFFRREPLDKGNPMLQRVAAEAYHTHLRMRDYDFAMSERVVDRSCQFMCSYDRLCTTELMGGNDTIVRRDFKTDDPHSYYFDEKVPD